MIGIDTNVLLRLFVENDREQARASRELIASARGDEIFLAQPVVLETFWLLSRTFGWKRPELKLFLSSVFDIPLFRLENRTDFEDAVDRYFLGNVDFPDCLIEVAGERAGVDTIYTFDRKAAYRRMFTQLKVKN